MSMETLEYLISQAKAFNTHDSEIVNTGYVNRQNPHLTKYFMFLDKYHKLLTEIGLLDSGLGYVTDHHDLGIFIILWVNQTQIDLFRPLDMTIVEEIPIHVIGISEDDF